MKKLVSRTHALVACTLPALFAADAMATDSKILPGAVCQKANDTPGGLVAWTSGRAYNDSSETATYVCPIVRDVTTETLNGTWVRVIDMHFAEDVRCRLHAKDAGGTGGYVGAWIDSSGTNTAIQSLALDSIGSVDGGVYYVECKVPGIYSGIKSAVASIRTDEP